MLIHAGCEREDEGLGYGFQVPSAPVNEGFSGGEKKRNEILPNDRPKTKARRFG